jgi:hypothetical protein
MLLHGWWVKLACIGSIIFLLSISPLMVGSAFPFSITVSIAAVLILTDDDKNYIWKKQEKGLLLYKGFAYLILIIKRMINVSKITRTQAQFCFKLNIMNESLSSLSLAQIVNSNHQAASVFEKYHLDFCCKGKRSLEQACTEQQLSIVKVTDDLKIFLQKTVIAQLILKK